ncbi:ABC transporter substrate-binding protein [Hominifimenecus sp. rT4P-3]|uniref:ABC transporter substrate-binding protein n=1 Tax=Hominifimenecus sp. rT4P-3 TaxID=3242979 RepID=UPI003DA1D22B
MKKQCALLLALAMVFTMTACGSQTEETVTKSGAAEAETTAFDKTEAAAESTAAAGTTAQAGNSAEGYPVTYTTYNYAKEPVEFTVEKTPERVWAHAQDSVEILLALGLGDKIVGASGLDGEVRPELAGDFAKLNYYESMPSKEEILALEPDFIVGWYSTFGEKRLGDVDFWHERGVGTWMALNSACRGPAVENNQTVEYECEDILALGRIFGVEDRAQALVDEILGSCDNINTTLGDTARAKTAVLEDEGGTYRVYGQDVLGGNVAEHGGAELVAGLHGNNENLSAEDLIALNPEVIFMVWYEGYTVGDAVVESDEAAAGLILDNPAFASLQAVQNGRVYGINLKYTYCSGMNTLEGIEYFAAHLYPDLFD